MMEGVDSLEYTWLRRLHLYDLVKCGAGVLGSPIAHHLMAEAGPEE